MPTLTCHLHTQDCYERFVCVENVKFSNPAKVAPGQSWRATATFSVVDVVKN